jgi:hypothetical protein
MVDGANGQLVGPYGVVSRSRGGSETGRPLMTSMDTPQIKPYYARPTAPPRRTHATMAFLSKTSHHLTDGHVGLPSPPSQGRQATAVCAFFEKYRPKER